MAETQQVYFVDFHLYLQVEVDHHLFEGNVT